MDCFQWEKMAVIGVANDMEEPALTVAGIQYDGTVMALSLIHICAAGGRTSVGKGPPRRNRRNPILSPAWKARTSWRRLLPRWRCV